MIFVPLAETQTNIH